MFQKEKTLPRDKIALENTALTKSLMYPQNVFMVFYLSIYSLNRYFKFFFPFHTIFRTLCISKATSVRDFIHFRILILAAYSVKREIDFHIITRLNYRENLIWLQHSMNKDRQNLYMLVYIVGTCIGT